MKARSPVLGYNHNVRYVGRTWHVQTEDSGVSNPHIFTHLFHDGTIIGSKKTDYDAAAEVTVVQKIMQSQHKLMLRDLKAGAFDEKIERIFGPIVREPEVADAPTAEVADAPVADVAAPVAAKVPPAPTSAEDIRPTTPDLGPLLPPPPAQPPTARPVTVQAPPIPASAASRPIHASLTPARRAVAVSARSNAAAPPPPTIGSRAAPPIPRTAPPTIGSGRSGVPTTPVQRLDGAAASGGVGVVARQTVIVGGQRDAQGVKDARDQKEKKGDTADFWKTAPTRTQQPEPTFGGELISEKSLDEVILAYLSEDAPKK